MNTDPGMAREAKTLGESNRGQRNQSTVSSVVTSAPVCMVTKQPVVTDTGIAVHVRPLTLSGVAVPAGVIGSSAVIQAVHRANPAA